MCGGIVVFAMSRLFLRSGDSRYIVRKKMIKASSQIAWISALIPDEVMPDFPNTFDRFCNVVIGIPLVHR